MSDSPFPSTSLAPPPLSCPTITPLGARTAAQDVYNSIDILRAILQLLPKRDLATFMRVKKTGMLAVAQVLYRVMKFPELETILGGTSERYAIYSSAVSEIHTRWDEMPIELHEQLGIVDFPDEEKQQRLLQFDAKIFNFVVSKVKAKCASVRVIEFRDPEWSDYWTVTFDAGTVTCTTLGDSSTSYSGRIHHYWSREFDLTSSPPPAIIPQSSPSAAYSLWQSIELHLIGGEADDRFHAEWLLALRTQPGYKNIGDFAHFGGLPVTLADISTLYQRQDETGYGYRMEYVYADYCSPFTLHDFESFARIASSSLTDLSLCRGYVKAGRERELPMSFGDLPALSLIIRKHLPNLGALAIGLKGISDAEEVCRGMLRKDLLDKPGTIYHLHVYTPMYTSAIFNVLRALFPLCAHRAPIFVGEERVRAPWPQQEQEGFMAFLHQLRPEQRAHVAMVDFLSLGIARPSQIEQHSFTKDGRLRNKAESEAMDLLRYMPGVGEGHYIEKIPALQAAIREFDVAQSAVDANIDTAGGAELLAGGKAMLQALRKVRSEAEEARAEAQMILDAAPRKMERNLEAMVKALERAQRL